MALKQRPLGLFLMPAVVCVCLFLAVVLLGFFLFVFLNQKIGTFYIFTLKLITVPILCTDVSVCSLTHFVGFILVKGFTLLTGVWLYTSFVMSVAGLSQRLSTLSHLSKRDRNLMSVLDKFVVMDVMIYFVDPWNWRTCSWTSDRAILVELLKKRWNKKEKKFIEITRKQG